MRLDEDALEDGLGQNPAETLEVEEVVLGDHRGGGVGKQVLVSSRTVHKAGRQATESHRTTRGKVDSFEWRRPRGGETSKKRDASGGQVRKEKPEVNRNKTWLDRRKCRV